MSNKEFYITIKFDSKVLNSYIKLMFNKTKNNKFFNLKEVIIKSTEKWIEEIVIPKYEFISKITIDRFIINNDDIVSLNFKDLIKSGLMVDFIQIRFKYKKGYKLGSFFITSDKLNKFYNGEYYNCSNKVNIAFISFRNFYYDSDVFKNIVDVDKCECDKNLIFYNNEDKDLPVFFKCQICGKLFVCECQRKYYSIMQEYYKINNNGNFLMDAEYKDSICHLCKKNVPEKIYNYSNLRGFAKKYYPYIKIIVDAELKCDYFDLLTQKWSVENSLKIKKLFEKAENYIREKTGYHLIGEQYVNYYHETLLYNICCNLYPDYKIIRQYSPFWLGKQSIDIYIEELNIGIEYQGEQHFKPVDIFGGVEAFKNNQERDKRKNLLCKENNLNLIYFNYDENLTEDLVLKKINEIIR